MAALTPTSFTALFMIYVFLSVPGSYAVTFTIVNKCSYTVWPAILSAAAAGALLRPTTGFALQPGDSNTVHMPPAWSGKLWGRTLCSHNFAGKFSCVTGDCGSSTVECGGDGNPALPVTLTEFTLNGTDGLDYFDVSLVDGFNLPVRVEPQGGTGAGNCRATSCPRNLNKKCPIELKVMVDGERVVACKSACQAEACNSTLLSQFFKSKCPHARVYAYDHGSFTCASADYSITFCPTSTSSIKAGNKKHSGFGDNSGGHVEDSALYVLLLVIKIVIPTVVSVSLIVSCVCCACQAWYRSPNRECGLNMIMGRIRAKTKAPNGELEMVDKNYVMGNPQF